MYIVIITSLLAILLTYLESRNWMKNGMKIGFLLITFLGTIHYDYGNDYMSYLYLFEEVTSYEFDISAILSGDYYRDPGWVLLCWLFKPIGGFFMMVSVLNIIQNIIVYRFIRDNVDKNWWWLSIIIYLFCTSFYLLSFSMMRQELVMIIFLGLWRFIKEKKWWIPLIVLYLCSFVHASSLVLIPFAFLGFVPVKNNKVVGIIFIVMLLMLWLFKDVLSSVFEFVMMSSEEFMDYTDTYSKDENKGLKLGLGFIVNMIPFILSMIFLMSQSNRLQYHNKLLVALSAISFMVTPFAQIISLSNRLGMYFGIYSIGAIPLIYSKVNNRVIKYALMALFILITLYDYLKFFKSEVWMDKYTEFHTIFPQIF